MRAGLPGHQKTVTVIGWMGMWWAMLAMTVVGQPRQFNEGGVPAPAGPNRVLWVNGYTPNQPLTPVVYDLRAEAATRTAMQALGAGLDSGPRVPKRMQFPGPTLARSILETPPVSKQAAAQQALVGPSTGFEAQGYDDNGQLTGFAFIPPDPNAAVGLAHVVVTNNVTIAAYDKQGNPEPGLPLQTLQSFFGGTHTFTFDPKALYDPFADRYLVLTLELVSRAQGAPINASVIHLAASPSGTPVGTWNAAALNARLGGNWCDFPGLAVDEEAIYITCNYFSFSNSTFQSSRLFVIDKAALYAGTLAQDDVSVFDPAMAAGTDGLCDFGFQPAQVHTVPDGKVGTWLVAFSGCSSPNGQHLHIIRVSNPLLGEQAAFTAWFPELGSLCATGSLCVPPDAPQLNSGALVSTNDARTLDAEWRNHHLWVAASINPASGNDAGQATAYWFRMDTNVLDATPPGAPVTITGQGGMGAEDLGSNTFTFVPSLSVNDECAIVAFSASQSGLYPGAYYAQVSLSDGSSGPTKTLRLGEDAYQRTFGGPDNRWGDYQSTVLDVTDQSFWIAGPYAQRRGRGRAPEDGRWGLFVGNDLCEAPLPIELEGFGAVVDGGDIHLTWRTASETNNAGFEVQHRSGRAGAATPDAYTALGFVEGHGTTSQAQSYAWNVAAADPGWHQFRLKQLDLDGSVAYSPVVEVFVELPTAYVLSEAWPNPFNPQTQFTLMVKQPQQVRLAVYNTLGQEVALLHEGLLAAEEVHTFRFEAGALPSGLYLYRAAGEHFIATRTMVLAK